MSPPHRTGGTNCHKRAGERRESASSNTCSILSGMETRKHWWNGFLGGMARQDLFIRVDGTKVQVQHRVNGDSVYVECVDEQQAFDEVLARMAADRLTGDRWREMPQ
jgi:hypothetical protein